MVQKPKTECRIVSIFVFEDVDLLDVAGPAEVFGATNDVTGEALFSVQLVAQHEAPVRTTCGVQLMPDLVIADDHFPDVLILPGGEGSRAVAASGVAQEMLVWLSKRSGVTLSVCTGARILAAAGLLSGMHVTTHHSALDEIAALAPEAIVESDARYTDNGRILTAAGVTAGIDLSLHLVARLLDLDTANAVADYLEHSWQQQG